MNMGYRAIRLHCLGWAILLMLTAASVRAHDPGLSTAACRVDATNLEAVLTFSIVDIAEVVEVDSNHDFKYAPEELQTAASELEKQPNPAVDVTVDGRAIPATRVRCQFDENNNAVVMLNFPVGMFTNLVIRSKWLAMMPPGHRQFMTVQTPVGQVLSERLLSADTDYVSIQLDAAHVRALAIAPGGAGEAAGPATAKSTGTRASFADFLLMGVRHIWTGYDHLLFLFGLLIVTRNFVSSVRIITCFTIAHSITLAVATLSLVQIPSKIVEPLIAASIVYVGIENLIRGDDPKGRWLLTFAFGLIHGFGFASVLRELGVGANGNSIAVPLVSFNLGVEVGQIVVAGIALPVIWKLRTYPLFIRRWVPVCSVVVALLGAYWFLQRILSSGIT